MKRKVCWLISLVVFLAACGPTTATPTATTMPATSTAVATATQGAAPAATITPTIMLPTPPLPTPTATRPAPPTSAATPSSTPITSRAVTFPAADGVPLGGTVHGSGSRWIILSNNGDGLQASWQPLTTALAGRGYTVLTYDWRGLGASSSARQDWQVSPRDLAGAITFARANGAQQLILGGGSLGGIASIKNARSAGVVGVIVISSPYTVAPLTISAEELAPITVPKLFIASKNDQVVPLGEMQFLHDNSPQPKKLQVYDGSAHGSTLVTSSDGASVIGLVTDFVAATFAGARAPLATLLQDTASTARWRADLRALDEGIRRVHPKPFWQGNEAAFNAEVAQLDRAIPYLDDAAIKVGFSRIAAMIDGHTNLSFLLGTLGFHAYPLRLYAFSDGIFVTAAQSPWDGAIGGRLVQVGGKPVEEAYHRIAPLAQHDNDMGVQLLTPVHMIVAEELRATGVITDTAQPAFVVAMPDGRQLTLNPAAITIDAYRAWAGTFSTLLKQPEPLYLSRSDERFWFTVLDDGATLYVQYNQVQSSTQSGETLAKMVERIDQTLNERPITRVIVDLRHNGGGDNNTYGPLLRFLQSARVNRRGSLFLITSRFTFSAAANFATEVERTTAATFVGEPMGGRPNLYGDVRPVPLPNSGLVVQVSSLYWQKSTRDDARPSIEPTLPAPLSSADYFNHRDPALAAILGR